MHRLSLMGALAASALLSFTSLGCSNTSATSEGGGGEGGGSAGSGGAAGVGGGGGGMGNPQPDPQFVPTATGTCPEFVDGDVTFAPAGIPERKVRIHVGADPTAQDGPVVFYWHGTGSSPTEVGFGLGAETIDDITSQGGIVAVPYSDPASGTFPWFLTTGSKEPLDDILVADEILACAIEKVGVDLRRIHTSGMSAGGLQTVQFGDLRSGYIASLAPYSGGRLGGPDKQDPSNKFAAMIFHGGPNDTVVVNFKTISETYLGDLNENGQFGFICDHGMGHTIPQDAQASVWQFFREHPFGTSPSPYAAGLPSGFPSYCSL